MMDGKSYMRFHLAPLSFTLSDQARIQDFLQGGGATMALGRADRGLGLINIRLRYIASIEYSERFFCCCC